MVLAGETVLRKRFFALKKSSAADAINLGLSKMADSCPGATYAKLTWLQAWHIRDEAYSKGLAALANAQNQSD